MKPFAITVEVLYWACPHIFHVTKPKPYTGCKHPQRWSWESGKPVPVCMFKSCPFGKRKLTDEEYDAML